MATKTKNITLTPDLKDRLIQLADGHQAADEYVAGTYWNDGRGCAIGCTIADAKRLKLVNGIAYDNHKAIADVLGVPEFVTQIIDAIFEGLPSEDRPSFTPAVLRAIQIGRDYSSLKDCFSAWCMLDPKFGLAHIAQRQDVRDVSKVIGELYSRRAASEAVADSEFDAARQQAYAAWQQAYAAWQQAYAARQQAYAAWQQAYAALQQADAALQQADAAWQQAYAALQQADAAWQQAYAARQEFWRACRDKLIELLGSVAA